MLAIGIDIGGTKIAGGVVDERGRLLRSLRVACPAGTPAIVDEIVAMVDELSAHDEIGVVGVAAAGFVSEDRSTIAHGPNIEWSGPPLKHQLEPRLATSVVLENDANAAAWGEYRFGAACETTNAVVLTVGTGVGGAIVVDGQLVRGSHGMAAELGHLTVHQGGLPCGCGKFGCLEQYASGSALQRVALENATAGSALARAIGRDGKIPGRAIAELVAAGNPAALDALDQVGSALGTACGTLQALVDPDVFVIGGGVAEIGDRFLAPVRRAYAGHLPTFAGRPEARIVGALLGNDAGVIGMADLARAEALALAI